jgi:hypothetical protein
MRRAGPYGCTARTPRRGRSRAGQKPQARDVDLRTRGLARVHLHTAMAADPSHHQALRQPRPRGSDASRKLRHDPTLAGAPQPPKPSVCARSRAPGGPVRAARTASPAVSLSRISPTRITSGSWRKIARKLSRKREPDSEWMRSASHRASRTRRDLRP